MALNICKAVTCLREVRCKGLCSMHYQRRRRGVRVRYQKGHPTSAPTPPGVWNKIGLDTTKLDALAVLWDNTPQETLNKLLLPFTQ